MKGGILFVTDYYQEAYVNRPLPILPIEKKFLDNQIWMR